MSDVFDRCCFLFPSTNVSLNDTLFSDKSIENASASTLKCGDKSFATVFPENASIIPSI
eukprot:CAMPEP_0117426836 /NCGR_PEP_ID=MMETSP0758-20121206/6837_1 /TAXON_ID=63605 /ORGANISM="Percolomonas cosmopolitus, Strain AE-1 (ATCC 50343)" /LENGTH=58 /DNA_ID=CAMNT_0005212177 /DNA_START=1316 /DNA_END=1492 /DNA_ORIENTATION=+